MIYWLFISLRLVLSEFSGAVYIPYDCVIRWKFPQDYPDYFQFAFFASWEAQQKFQWFGWGMKYPQDGQSMKNSDMWVINIKEHTVDDRWAEQNGQPLIDVEEGGQENTYFVQALDSQTHTINKVFRDKITQDLEFDLQLVQGDEYYLLWAFGHYEEDGVTLAYHGDENRGMQIISFTPQYVDDSIEDQEVLPTEWTASQKQESEQVETDQTGGEEITDDATESEEEESDVQEETEDVSEEETEVASEEEDS